MSQSNKAGAGFTKGSGNVFADLGLENPTVHKIKADLALRLNKQIDQLNCPQTELATRLGLQQPHVSQLRHYRLKGFSVERLMDLLVKLGVPVDIQVGAHRTPCAELRVVTKAYEKLVIRAKPSLHHDEDFIWQQAGAIVQRHQRFTTGREPSSEVGEFMSTQKMITGHSNWRVLQ